jgi:hypothetical protein
MASRLMNDYEELISNLLGQKVCRIQVDDNRSLSIGFGEKVFHQKKRSKDSFYGQWELGSYYPSWRLIKNDRILVGAHDLESVADIKLNLIELLQGRLINLEIWKTFNITLYFDDEIIIEFFPATNEEDELFHIFCPENKYIELNSYGKVRIMQSNAPVSSENENCSILEDPLHDRLWK